MFRVIFNIQRPIGTNKFRFIFQTDQYLQKHSRLTYHIIITNCESYLNTSHERVRRKRRLKGTMLKLLRSEIVKIISETILSHSIFFGISRTVILVMF